MLNYDVRPGTMLENYMNSVCIMINSLGGHAHKNNAMRTFAGKYIAGEPFDYEIFAGDKVYCFDAKENMSGGSHWVIRMTGTRGRNSNERLKKQALNLVHCRNNGAHEAFFLVAFNNRDNKLPYSLVKYDAQIVYNSLTSGRKRLEFSEGTRFDLDAILNSIRKE